MPLDVRPLTAADLDWVAGLAAERRASLVPHAPRFWNPAPDAAARHRAFLGHLIDDGQTLALRTDRGFLLALDRPRYRLVDDLVVAAGAWPTDGAALLGEVVSRGGGGGRVRVVVPAFEEARRETVLALGLRVVEEWWHRDLPVVEVRAGADPAAVELSAEGTVGRLVPAPPIYAPGGPVLLVTTTTGAGALAAVETEAAARGATVAVVSRRPDDHLRDLLVAAGYVQTTLYAETP